MRNLPLRKLVFAAVVAAVYAALTMVLAPISYGAVQFRLSEVLCILPFFFPFSMWGLFLGCMLANVLSGYGLLDIVFGSIATLLAAGCTAYLGRRFGTHLWSKVLACLPPVFFNAIIVGAIIAWFTTPDSFWSGFWIFSFQIAAGEAGVMLLVGLPLMIYFPKTPLYKKTQHLIWRD